MRIARVAVAAGLLALAAPPAPAQVATVGSVMEFEFGSPLVNGVGVTGLSSLRGKPTLIEFWGTY